MRAEVNGARRKVLRERKARKEIKKPNVPAPGDVSPFSLRSSRRGATSFGERPFRKGAITRRW